MTTGLYFHIPFCKQKCNYCDFASFAGRENLISAYLQALDKSATSAPKREFSTLYVGGGTPSLLSAGQLEEFCALIARHFGPVSHFEESTIEANPESLTAEKLAVLKRAGFNRISMGLQSFNDAELKTLGRVHNVQTFLSAYSSARNAGFTNINVDLIAGVPGQSLQSFLDGLQKLVDLHPEHLSVYGLQIEEGTPFFERGLVCDQLLMRRMLEEAHTRLQAAGYHHYEISNFALSGREAKHNTHYWHNCEYLGVGSGAASYLGGVRSQNTDDVADFIARINDGKSPIVYSEKLEGKEHDGENLMLGLRLLDGIELTPLQEQLFGKDIEKHIQSGLLERAGKKVKLTLEGLFLANEVFCSFVAPFDQ
ncbi:radical SAM family heme chaperone HemW [Candidatus Avelusimicrobium stercoris]|uniref:radical SAM family heme chaperone HemW n=1 Tax=Candidatus Avelusimicrobium stercoris TaxID=1947924 RepID=UPI003D143A63